MNTTADALMAVFGFKRVKPKTCKVCRTKFHPTRPMQPVCESFECRVRFAEQKAEKSRAERKKAERKADKERKEKLKTRSDWLKEAQVAFNAFIRERDRLAGFRCISSGRPLDWSGNAVDAGHYRSTGAAPHLRFNEDNCHAQSKHDNQYLAGNAVDYRINLVKRIGLARVEALESDNTPRKWTVAELKAIRDLYRAKLKELKA